MKVREADLGDKTRWDSFVDVEGGDYSYYFDWKWVYESRGDRYIPLVVENDSSELLGILPLVKQKKFLHSILVSLPDMSGGFLLKKELPEAEQYDAIRILIKHIDQKYSKGCSVLRIWKGIIYVGERRDVFEPRYTVAEKALADSGLKYTHNETTGFPCEAVMELKQPFEEHIWRGLWGHRIRQKINKAVKDGVTVIEDKEFKYKDIFTDMAIANYRRHGNKQELRSEMQIRFGVFKDKTKLFIALLDGCPAAGQLCHYTASACHLVNLGSYSRETGHISKVCIKTAIEDACNAGYRFAGVGVSMTPGEADFKSKLRFTLVPAGMYQKTCSVLRNRVHQASLLMELLQRDKMYLWHNWRKVLKKLINMRE